MKRITPTEINAKVLGLFEGTGGEYATLLGAVEVP